VSPFAAMKCDICVSVVVRLAQRQMWC